MSTEVDSNFQIKDDGDPTKIAMFQCSGIGAGTTAEWAFQSFDGTFSGLSGVDVRHYGAVGDGVTDDTTAVRAAINAAPAGSVVYIPSGSYNLATWTVLTVSKRLWIRGDGAGNTILTGTTGNSFISYTENLRVSDLTLTSWSTVLDCSAVTGVITQVLFENLRITSFNRAIYGNGSTASTGIRGFVVRNCHIETGTSYGIFLNVPIMERVHILQNVIKDVVQRSIDLGGNSLVFADDRGNYVIDGNIVDGCTAVGASAIAVIVYGWRATITNNVVKNVSRDSPTASDCDGIYTKCRYSVVANNVLVDAGQAEGFINIKGGARDETVSQPYGFSVIVSNNMLVDTQTSPTLAGGDRQTSGIKIATSEVLVIGNHVEGLTESGIYTDSDSEASHPNHNIVIQGNFIKNHRGGAAISVYGRGDRIRVFDNLIDTVSNSFDTSGQNFGIDVNKKEGSGIDITHNRVYGITDTGTTPVGISISPGSLSKTVSSVNTGTETMTTSAIHTFSVNDPVKFSSTVAVPAPLVAGTTYYILTVPTTTTFTLSATVGGATIDLTDSGSGTTTVYKVVTLSGWRIADNYVEDARYGIQFTWDQTYVSVDDVLVRHNTGRDINNTTPAVTTDLVKYTDTPTTLTDIPIEQVVVREAADDAAIYNSTGANPQELRIYNERVDASNYERLSLQCNSTAARIATQFAGTLSGGAAASLPLEIDINGTQVWKWTASGHYQPVTTSTYDIGSTSLRTRDVYIGGDLLVNNAASRVYLDYTNSATVGNVTIHKASGQCNMAAGAAAVTVTNNRVTAASHVIAVAAANDTTGSVKNVVPAAGSFTINSPANCTANMAINFVVFNAD